jgi:hypothetical protein
MSSPVSALLKRVSDACFTLAMWLIQGTNTKIRPVQKSVSNLPILLLQLAKTGWGKHRAQAQNTIMMMA